MAKTCTHENCTNPVLNKLLEHWDKAYIDLSRNRGKFKHTNVRLRECSLNFNSTTDEYYLRYVDHTFGLCGILDIRAYES